MIKCTIIEISLHNIVRDMINYFRNIYQFNKFDKFKFDRYNNVTIL